MQGYILAMLGIVVISVLVEIILPSGQTSKYIKSILAVFIVYIIVNPIITFLKSDFASSSISIAFHSSSVPG